MAEQINILITKPDDLSYISRTHMQKGEDQLLQIIPRPLHMYHNMYTFIHTQAQNRCN